MRARSHLAWPLPPGRRRCSRHAGPYARSCLESLREPSGPGGGGSHRRAAFRCDGCARQGLLLQLGGRGKRVRHQARAEGLTRSASSGVDDRLLPRTNLGHAGSHGSAFEAGGLRSDARGIHPCPLWGSPGTARRARQGRCGRSPARVHPGRGRHQRPARRLLDRCVSGLSSCGSAADRRRGADGARPHRHVVLVPRRGPDTRHRDDGQGARQRLPRRGVLGGDLGRGPLRPRGPWLDLRRPTGGDGRRRGDARHHDRPGCARTGPASFRTPSRGTTRSRGCRATRH